MARYRVTMGFTFASVVMSALIIWQAGWDWRIPERRIHPSPGQFRETETAYCEGGRVDEEQKADNNAPDPLVTCVYNSSSDKKLYVWGDSHARHLLPGLATHFPDYNIRILYLTSCLAQSGIAGFRYAYEGRTALAEDCVARNKRAMAFFQEENPAPIILHQYFGYEGQFSPSWYDSTRRIVTELSRKGHRIAFVGAVPRPAVALADCLVVPETIPDWLLARRCRGDRSVQGEIVDGNNRLEQDFPDIFVNINHVLCRPDGSCPIVDGSELIYRDKHHLTEFASKQVVGAIRAQLSDLLGLEAE